jgi:hypothetical protein
MSNINIDHDFEFAVRLQLHDQGIVNEEYIDNYIDILRNNNYNLNMIHNPLRNFDVSDEEFNKYLSELVNYRFLDNFSLINRVDYSMYVNNNNNININNVNTNNINTNNINTNNINTNNINTNNINPFQHILDNLNNLTTDITFQNMNNEETPPINLDNQFTSIIPPQINQQYPGIPSISASFEINNNNIQSGRNFLQSVLNTIISPIQEDVIVPLANESIEELNNVNKYTYEEFKEKLFNNGKDIDPACSICQTSYDEEIIETGKDDIIQLDCKHYFHATCINEWLKNYNHICPICKSECGNTNPRT